MDLYVEPSSIDEATSSLRSSAIDQSNEDRCSCERESDDWDIIDSRQAADFHAPQPDANLAMLESVHQRVFRTPQRISLVTPTAMLSFGDRTRDLSNQFWELR